MTLIPPILAIGFVTPWFFAAGFALAAVPIVIHILNRRRFKTVNWAAMEFLLRAMRRNHRRLRFEQWLLLAMRCLVLLFLGLALARPMGCDQSSLVGLASRRSGLHVIVIDNSYSMAYEADRADAKTNFDQAKILAKGLIDRMSRGGESVAVVLAGRPATALFAAPTYDLQTARDAVDRVEQSFGGTDLAGALERVRQIAASESSQPEKTLHLITDATRSAWEPANASELPVLGRELSRTFKIIHYNVGQAKAWNQAVVDLRSASNLVRSQFNNDFIADARGFGSGTEPLLQWQLDGQLLPGAVTLQLTAEQHPAVQSLSQIKQGGLHVISAALASEDRLKADDIRSRVIDVAAELKVLIVEGERGTGALSGSGAFLQLALAPPTEAGTPDQSTARSNSYVQPELISDLELGNKVLTDYRAVVLCNVGSIQPAMADRIVRFVEQGGTLMLFMGDSVNSENYNETLLTRHLLPGPLTKRVTISGDQHGYLFDFQPHGNLHPFLNVFRGAEKPGLDTAQVFTYWQADVPANANVERILNYLPADTGKPSAGALPDPAITVQDVGAGHALFFSTTANADWTSLPAKPAYVALMHELLAGSVSSGDAWMNRTVGEQLEIPASLRMTAAPTLKDPAQTEITLEPSSGNAARFHSRPLAKPGIYTLETGSRSIPIAVNIPSDESDIRAVDSSVIRKALGDVDVQFEADQLPPLSPTNDTGKDFGWSFMAIVLMLVGLECFLAMRFGHYRR